MDFELSDEQKLLRDTVRDFARQEVKPVAEELDREKRFPYEIVGKLGELGLMGMPYPEEYGGGGFYTEIDRPNRLAFTWIWDGSDTRQLIELDFEEADGVTTVRFAHIDLWDEQAVRDHEDGWGKAFDNLARTLEGG